MLKQRIITGVIMALVATLAIALLDSWTFSLLSFIIVIGVGSWEWTNLCGKAEGWQRYVIPALAVVTGLILWLNAALLPGVLLFSSVLWITILVLLAVYQQGTGFYQNRPWLLRFMGVATLVPAWYALSHLHGDLHYAYVLYLVGLIAVADSAAFFAGKRFGRVKLAESLSPGKTREGFLGGVLAAVIWATLGALLSDLPARDWPTFVLLSVLVVVLSVAGDLFESLLKREAGAKDSGSILPGHGGVLDRIDSLVAATPIFLLGLMWIKG